MPPVHYKGHFKGDIQRSTSIANGGKITKEYSRDHQISAAGHISSLLIKICQQYGIIAPYGLFLDHSMTPLHHKGVI